MIAIDTKMPKNCVECRFGQSECGFCHAATANFVGYVYQSEDEGKPDWCPLIDISPKLADNLEVWPCPVHPILGGGTVPTYSFNCPKCGKRYSYLDVSCLDTHDFFCDACGQQIIFKENKEEEVSCE